MFHQMFYSGLNSKITACLSDVFDVNDSNDFVNIAFSLSLGYHYL